MVDLAINALRPFQLKGKGFLFNYVTPHSGIRKVSVWGPHRMTLDLGNGIQRQIFMGCCARQIVTWTRLLLPRGGTFLDVGANIGYFSLLAADLVGSQGRVLAVEPNPTVFKVLREHLDDNQICNVQAEMTALDSVAGTLRLYLPPASEKRDYNVTCLPRDGWDGVDVACRTLDEFLSTFDVPSVDLMKVDVEGAEPRVFAGGRNSLSAGVVRHVICEVNGPRLTEAGSSPKKLVELLRGFGFYPAKISSRHAAPLSDNTWDLDSHSEYDRLFMHESIL